MPKTRIRNRRKGQCFEQHIFECPVCSNKYSLFRAKAKLRPIDHKKWLWCYKCKRKRNFIELGQY